jgi:glycopeptide antibiotics resistance protein
MNFQKKGSANMFTSSLLIIYLVALVWIILFKLNIQYTYLEHNRSLNLVPFNEPLILNGKPDLGEIKLNALIYIPLGVYVGILFQKWSIIKKILLFFVSSLILEVLQYILAMGASDITDIINNTLGGIIGLTIYTILEKIFPQKAQKIINILAALATVCIVSLLLYLKINKLLMFRK